MFDFLSKKRDVYELYEVRQVGRWEICIIMDLW